MHGEFFLATCLQTPLNDLKAESATMMGTFPNFRAVAAPILRPQRMTL